MLLAALMPAAGTASATKRPASPVSATPWPLKPWKQESVVISRRHFYAVHADHVQGRQAFEQGQQLRTAQAARLRRAGAGRKGLVMERSSS